MAILIINKEKLLKELLDSILEEYKISLLEEQYNEIYSFLISFNYTGRVVEELGVWFIYYYLNLRCATKIPMKQFLKSYIPRFRSFARQTIYKYFGKGCPTLNTLIMVLRRFNKDHNNFFNEYELKYGEQELSKVVELCHVPSISVAALVYILQKVYYKKQYTQEYLAEYFGISTVAMREVFRELTRLKIGVYRTMSCPNCSRTDIQVPSFIESPKCKNCGSPLIT